MLTALLHEFNEHEERKLYLQNEQLKFNNIINEKYA